MNVAAAAAGQPAAVVVPLAAQETGGSGTRLVGLVSFYVGCGGRAYFGSVADDLGAGAGRSDDAFPRWERARPRGQLSTSTPQLVYTTSPFTPEWRNAQSGATIPAGE